MASEVELLQVMAAPSLRLFGGSSSIGSLGFGGAGHAQGAAKGAAAARPRDKVAWRGSLRPALDRAARWVAFHGRPDGQQRQVLVTYLGDPDQLWLLGAQY
jgi:hypothetical protein